MTVSLMTFAIIEAAETTGIMRSAPCIDLMSV